MLYVWARRNPDQEINLMEVFTIRAQFLPWTLMILTVVFGFEAHDDLVGAVVGQMYYFLMDVLPKIPETRNLKMLAPPDFLTRFCNWLRIHEQNDLDPNFLGWFYTDDDDLTTE